MTTAYIMSERDLVSKLAKFTATVKEMQEGAQTLLLPCVERAIRDCNATYCNQLLAAVPDKMKPYMREYMTRKGVPVMWDKDKKKVVFSFRAAQAIYKDKSGGKAWESSRDPNKLSDVDKECLAFVSAIAITVLGAGKWYDNLKAEQKAEREAKNAAKTQEDKAKAILDSFSRLEKKAKELGVDLPSSTAAPLPKPLEDVVKMLSPVADNNAMMASVVAAIASCLQVNKQAA